MYYDDNFVGRPHYELSLPSEYGPTKSTELVFYPNKLLHIMCLEFGGLWNSFIDALNADLGNEEIYPTLTFSDILKIAKEKDNLTSFDFEKILRADKVSEICKEFLAEPSLNIALIDNLNPK